MLGYLCAVPLHKKVLFLTEIIANFAVALIKQVSVVQWIEFRIPVPTIGVRLPTGILKRDGCKSMACNRLFFIFSLLSVILTGNDN